MATLLVTGGLGFIGSNYVLHAVKAKKFSKIVNLDAVSYGANLRNLSELEGKPGYQFVKSSTTNTQRVRKLLSEIDVVVHFAAETHVDRSISNPEAFLNSNVVGTFSLLEAARKSNITKFLHISTDEVYGSASKGTSYVEESRFDPSSPYAASKAASEAFVVAYYKTYGLPTVILRCTNNFGPRQFPEKFIPKMIITTLLGGKIPIYGDGSHIRDWIYVSDFCKAIDLAMEKGKNGVAYNVSAGNEISNLQVAKMVLTALGSSPNQIRFVEDRPGHDFRYSLDSSRIRDELGWRPDHLFADALEKTVEWYVNNRNWWSPLWNEKIQSAAPWREEW